MYYESKAAQTHFLQANDIPHPKTKVYYRAFDAYMAFHDLKRDGQKVNMGAVWKSNMGSSSKGVKLFNTTHDLCAHVDILFQEGILCPQTNALNRNTIEYDFAIFQQFIKDYQEWMVLIIGNRVWARKKMKTGNDFRASGKGITEYGIPDTAMLDLCREIKTKLSFNTICVDVLQRGNEYLVSEFSTFWGNMAPGTHQYLHPMKYEDTPGCYLYNDKWGYTWKDEDIHINELRILTLKRAIEEKNYG